MTDHGLAPNRIASDAYPRMPPEARETIVIDQFVSGLPSKDLRRHVQFHHPSFFHEAMALASEFESFEESFDGREPENPEKEIGTSIRSFSEEESGHEELLKVLQSEQTGSCVSGKGYKSCGDNSTKRSGVCFRCNEKGQHNSRQWPTTTPDESGNNNAPIENAPSKEN